MRVIVDLEVRPLPCFGLPKCAQCPRRGEHCAPSSGLVASIPVEIFDAERSVGERELVCRREGPGEACVSRTLITDL